MPREAAYRLRVRDPSELVFTFTVSEAREFELAPLSLRGREQLDAPHRWEVDLRIDELDPRAVEAALLGKPAALTVVTIHQQFMCAH